MSRTIQCTLCKGLDTKQDGTVCSSGGHIVCRLVAADCYRSSNQTQVCKEETSTSQSWEVCVSAVLVWTMTPGPCAERMLQWQWQ